jgi:hypothetical protein
MVQPASQTDNVRVTDLLRALVDGRLARIMIQTANQRPTDGVRVGLVGRLTRGLIQAKARDAYFERGKR